MYVSIVPIIHVSVIGIGHYRALFYYQYQLFMNHATDILKHISILVIIASLIAST